MKFQHLTELQVQAYLDDSPESQPLLVEAHLEECARCRANVDAYRSLYTSLASEEPPSLPTGFSRAVLGRLPLASTRRFELKAGDMTVLAAAVGAILLAGSLMIDLSFATDWLGSGVSFDFGLSALPAKMMALVSAMNGYAVYGAYAVTLLILFGGADRVLLKPRAGRSGARF